MAFQLFHRDLAFLTGHGRAIFIFASSDDRLPRLAGIRARTLENANRAALRHTRISGRGCVPAFRRMRRGVARGRHRDFGRTGSSQSLQAETAEEVQAGTLFDRLRSVGRVTQEILREARGTRNHIVAIQAIGRIERQLELETRLLGELDDSTKIAMGVRTTPVGPPDVSHLTPDQVLDELRVLEEATQKIEVIRARKEPTAAIEAAAGSVEEVVVDRSDTVVSAVHGHEDTAV